MSTLERILDLMAANHCDNQKLASALGLNRQAVTDWKSGRSKSYIKYLPQLAKFFDVTVDYLLGNIEYMQSSDENEFEFNLCTEQEKTLLVAFRGTTEEGRMRIIQTVLNICDDIEATETTGKDSNSTGAVS